MKFRDLSRPIPERVQDLIDQLTIEEKVGQLVVNNDAIERLGIGAYHWWNEALHGFADCGVATVFPQAIGLAATWCPERLKQVADIAAREGRAKNNVELRENEGNSRANHGLTIWSPNINIFRDPRWGRGQETYGEDPCLTAALGNAFVQGLQGDDPRHLKAVATLKHFAVHSGLEPITILDGLKQKLAPLGTTIVQEVGIALAEGHSTGGAPIPPGVLFVDEQATRGGLICRMYNSATPEGSPVIERVETLPELEWNTARPRPAQLTEKEVCVVWSGYIKLACAGAYTFYNQARGRCNVCIGDREALPNWGIRKILQKSILHYLPGDTILPITITWGQTQDEGFCSLTWDPADDGAGQERAHQRALALARESDLCILALGLSHKVEGEEMSSSPKGFDRGDRATIALPAPQQRLLDEVSALGKPVVLLLSTGSAVSFDPGKANAVLQTWYYGAQGGRAIADALFGEFSPAGRLPITFYRSDSDLPDFQDYAMKERTYRYFSGTPLFAFGHGLSYTRFVYDDLVVSCTGEDPVASLTLTNAGPFTSDEVVQLYASRDNPDTGDPIRRLVGFERARDLNPRGDPAGIYHHPPPLAGTMVRREGRAGCCRRRYRHSCRTGVSGWAEATRRGRTVWIWTMIWPHEPASIGGIVTPLKSACLLPERTPLQFEQSGGRIRFTDLPAECPDTIANRAVIELEFDGEIERCVFGTTPALRYGKEG